MNRDPIENYMYTEQMGNWAYNKNDWGEGVGQGHPLLLGRYTKIQLMHEMFNSKFIKAYIMNVYHRTCVFIFYYTSIQF